MQVTPAAIEAVEQQVAEMRARTGCARPVAIHRSGRSPRLGFSFREGVKAGDVVKREDGSALQILKTV